jgi:hypothetical protein
MNAQNSAALIFLTAVVTCMWVWSEYTHYQDTVAYERHIKDFVEKGDRYTAEQGRSLEVRVEKLESIHID